MASLNDQDGGGGRRSIAVDPLLVDAAVAAAKIDDSALLNDDAAIVSLASSCGLAPEKCAEKVRRNTHVCTHQRLLACH